MRSTLREFILHQDSVQYEYLSMEHSLFDSWSQSWARHNRKSVRLANQMRERMHAGLDAVPGSDTYECRVPSAEESERKECEAAQRPAARIGTVRNNQDAKEWPCNGPNCHTILRNKSEWQIQRDRKAKKRRWYCMQCWNSNNVVALSQ